MMETLQAAISSAQTDGVTLHPRALIWVQGESDATAAFAPHYASNLAYLISRLRIDIKAPGMMAWIGVNTRFGNGKNPHMPRIIESQKKVAALDSLTQYVDTAGAETLPPNHTHFTSKGTLEVGERFASALLALAPKAKALFNGKDLSGWDGDPNRWRVENGIVVGENPSPAAMAHNSFLIWRAGTVKDFELRATLRVIGDNNSGLQYRSRELREIAPWVVSGYQCDIHPASEHTGMTYEERGRGIFGLNGKDVLVDPEGVLWQLAERPPLKVDVSQWNEYRVIVRGEQIQHFINGRLTSSMVDHHEAKRSLEGLLAIQLHKGNPNRVEIRDLRLVELEPTSPRPFHPGLISSGSVKIEKPRTRSPQGTGPIQ
jgi:hypothetical protein